MVNLDLRSCKPSLVTSSPSIVMVPDAGSKRRNTEYVKDDFPAPVLPTIPIYRKTVQTIKHKINSITYVRGVFKYECNQLNNFLHVYAITKWYTFL